jgi:hypothetical protein
MYDTTQVWNDLATTGRARLNVLRPSDPMLTEQLRAEASEEGVSIKVDFKLNKTRGDYNAYVYLRKTL